MRLRTTALLLTALQGLSSCSESETAPTATTEVVPFSAVEWEQLNPARGDQSPLAATLYGARDGSAATGFLLRPVDGFRSPPHIHNVSYRAVVIRGLLHNDDPSAASEWMPPGSFWTQPRGGVHVTAARGDDTLAYVEIDAGPYLVLPVDDEFSAPEAPINVDPSNVVWLEAADVAPLVGRGLDGVRVAFLWGDPRGAAPGGAFVELPAGFDGFLNSYGDPFRAVVVEGRVDLYRAGAADPAYLEPGSYWGSTGESVHPIRCELATGCVLYVRTDGGFDLRSK